jgi:hypothetical protein
VTLMLKVKSPMRRVYAIQPLDSEKWDSGKVGEGCGNWPNRLGVSGVLS